MTTLGTTIHHTAYGVLGTHLPGHTAAGTTADTLGTTAAGTSDGMTLGITAVGAGLTLGGTEDGTVLTTQAGMADGILSGHIVRDSVIIRDIITDTYNITTRTYGEVQDTRQEPTGYSPEIQHPEEDSAFLHQPHVI